MAAEPQARENGEQMALPARYISCQAINENGELIPYINVDFTLECRRVEGLTNVFNQDAELDTLSDSVTSPVAVPDLAMEKMEDMIACGICYGLNRLHEKALVCFQCSQFVCKSCRVTIMETDPLNYKCPMCKSTCEKWTRNKTIEQVTLDFFRKFNVSCNFCHIVDGDHDAVSYHSSLCVNRRFPCPSQYYYKVCAKRYFERGIADLLQHLSVGECPCAEVVVSPSLWDQTFTHTRESKMFTEFVFNIEDDAFNPLIGSKRVAIFSPKVLLSDMTLMGGIPVLHIDRLQNGTWNVIIQLMAPSHITKFWTIHYNVTNFDKENCHRVQFSAKPIPQNMTKYQAESEYNRACKFTDDDIRRIRPSFDNPDILFQVKVTMELEETFGDNVAKIAAMNIKNRQASPFNAEERDRRYIVIKGKYHPITVNEIQNDEYIP